MALGVRIKEFGLQKYDSLKDFATAMGKTSPDLSQYLGENARREPGAGFLKRLYEIGCDMNWLFAESNLVRERQTDYKSNVILAQKEEIRQLKAKLRNIKKNLEGEL